MKWFHKRLTSPIFNGYRKFPFHEDIEKNRVLTYKQVEISVAGNSGQKHDRRIRPEDSLRVFSRGLRRLSKSLSCGVSQRIDL